MNTDGSQSKDDGRSKTNLLTDDSLPEVEGILESSGKISCEEPQARNDNPMYLADFGDDWRNQPVEGYSPPNGFWFGGEGISVGDFTQDSRLDIFVPTLERNLLFVQQNDGSFLERSEDLLPFQFPSLTVGASAADYDGDQDLDLFVLNLIEPNQLFENQGNGFFIDRSIEMGIVQNSYYYPGATWGDSDHDGDLDLLVLTTGSGPNGPPPWNDAENFEACLSNC